MHAHGAPRQHAREAGAVVARDAAAAVVVALPKKVDDPRAVRMQRAAALARSATPDRRARGPSASRRSSG